MSGEPLRVLLVEDEPGHAELARRAFEARVGDFVVSVVETVDAARAALHGAAPPDLVIADWLLPDGEGLDLLRSEPARAMPPMVIMTSHGSERVAVEAIRAGAVDYFVKSEVALADLPHIAERAVRHRRVEEAVGKHPLPLDLALGPEPLDLRRRPRGEDLQDAFGAHDLVEGPVVNGVDDAQDLAGRGAHRGPHVALRRDLP